MRHHHRSLTLFALLFGLSVWSASAQSQAPLPDSRSIAGLGSELFLETGGTGMVLVVVRDDQVYFKGYGETAPHSQKLPTEASLLRLCSPTKIFTTDLLSKLVIDKTVRLDDALQLYAPAKIVVPKRSGAVTLRDLATHTSGLPRELQHAPSGAAHFTFPDYHARWNSLPNQRLRSTPGSAALYSNLAFDFLGDALGAATHKQYAALLAERTLYPLHMQHTTLFPTPEQCGQLLAGVRDEGPCTSTEATAGSSGLYSTAADMTTWLKYLLGTGALAIPGQDSSAQIVYLLPSKLVSQKGLDHAGQPTGIGLGWIHILPVDSPSHIIEKTGGGAGFTTYIAINHARRTAVFLAFTEGALETHVNPFDAANKFLLAVAGLPPLPPPSRPVMKHKRFSRQHAAT